MRKKFVFDPLLIHTACHVSDVVHLTSSLEPIFRQGLKMEMSLNRGMISKLYSHERRKSNQACFRKENIFNHLFTSIHIHCVLVE